MRRGSSLVGVLIICTLWVVSVVPAASSTGSVSDLSKWDVTSHQVKLVDNRGGSGDIQSDQNGWIHLGANHLDGGDIKYEVQVGNLSQADILEVWIDGYSTSNDLNTGPTIFIGTGKNRYEQITRMTGDAWRPFVFRFADDAMYGDVTDPSNRNENWRTRYPSSKYEVRRIDKSPQDLLANGTLPVRISITGTEDFIVKRLEVVVYRAKSGSYGEGLFMVNLSPYTVRRGDMVTVQLNKALPSENVDFYLVDPVGQEHSLVPRILSAEKDRLGFYLDDYLVSKRGQYQVKLVDRSDPGRENVDSERFEYLHSISPLAPKPTPEILAPGVECPPTELPPIPQAPLAYMAPPTFMTPPTYMAPPAYIAPAPAPSVVVPHPGYARGYTIQIGAFRTQATAIATRDKLRRNGYDAYIVESVDRGNHFFRVRVGRYSDKSLALRDADRLRHSGFDTWITDLS